MPRSAASVALAALALLIASPPAASAPPRVVVSIAPLHSLVTAVTGDRAEPHLIVPAGQSPHTFSLAPSDARALARADIVFLAGGATDRFLERPLDSLAGDAVKVRLLDMDGVRTLRARSGGAWHDGHMEEEPGDGTTPGASEDASIDPHAWLDPGNAIAFVRATAQRLARLDPDHAGAYRANAEAAIERIEAIDTALRNQLGAVAERPYLVFHDAYQYFERRYGLTAAGSIVVDPGRPPGARRLSELRDRIRILGTVCLFVEPQFEPQIARTITEGTGTRIDELDPLGAGLPPGPDLYPDLLRRLGDSLRACLTGSSNP